MHKARQQIDVSLSLKFTKISSGKDLKKKISLETVSSILSHHLRGVLYNRGPNTQLCYSWRRAHPPPGPGTTDLVELKDIQKVKELPVLLVVLQFHVVLLQPMQRQLRLIIHEDLHWLRGRGRWGGEREEGRVGGLNLGGWRKLISNTPHGGNGEKKRLKTSPHSQKHAHFHMVSSTLDLISFLSMEF